MTPLPLAPAYGLREGSGTSTADDAGVGPAGVLQGNAAWASTAGGPAIRTAAPGDFLDIPFVNFNPFDADTTAYTVLVGFKPSAFSSVYPAAVHKRIGYGNSMFGILNTGTGGTFQGIASSNAGDVNVATADTAPLTAGTAYIGALRVQSGAPLKLRIYNRATGQIVGTEVASASSLGVGSMTIGNSNFGVTVGRRTHGDGNADLPGDYEFFFYTPNHLSDAQLDAFAANPYANYAGLSPLVPGTIGFGATTPTSAVVNLTGTNGGQSPYSVQFQKAPDASGVPGSWTNVGTAGTATSVTVTGLTAATPYWFRATVADSAGSAPATTTAANVTTPGAGAALAIGPPTLTNTAPHRVGASWSAATGGTGPYAYKLQQAPNANGSPGTWSDVGTAGTATTGTAVGLDPGATYYFKVIATDSASGSAISSAASIVTTLPDIPGYATWWGRMKSVAAGFNPGLAATTAQAGNVNVQVQLNHDGAYGALQALALRPGDPDLVAYRDHQIRLYRDAYLVPNNGSVQGPYNFPEGLGLDWQVNGSTASRDALLLLRNNAAYVTFGDVSDQIYSREAAYAILTHMEADRLGLVPRDATRFPYLVNCALGHIDQWLGDPAVWVATGSPFLQCFMMGVTGIALAKYTEFLAAKGLPADNRVLPALIRMAVRMRERFWRANSGDFIWPTAPDGTQFDNGSDPNRNNDVLDMESANFFGWLYKQTGSDYFKTAGDEAFAHGAATGGYDNPKQWNQGYRWSFLHAKWRQATPIDNRNSYVIDAPFVPNGQVGSASTAFRVVPLKPLTGRITPNDNGGGGTFSPAYVDLANSMAPASFTYTPASAGAKQIGATNTAGATDPAAVSYAATAGSGGGGGTGLPVFPAASKVQAGTVYGPTGAEFTGSLTIPPTPIYPAANQVLSGVVFGPTGSTTTGTLSPGGGSGVTLQQIQAELDARGLTQGWTLKLLAAARWIVNRKAKVKLSSTTSRIDLYNDAGSAVIGSQPVADDGQGNESVGGVT